jgi:Mg2+ and Co2+ transporter CorA
VRALLYDADGRDRAIELEPGMAGHVRANQLLWIDVDRREPADLQVVSDAFELGSRIVRGLAEPPDRADLTHYPDHIHLLLQTIEGRPTDASTGEPPLARRAVDIVAGRNWVVTVHEGPLPALERLDSATHGDTRLGALDASSFVAAVADELLADYLDVVEDVEREIDRLDQRALANPVDRDVLNRIVRIRRRIGFIRRTLAPHRVAFAALARPDMALHEELGEPWPALTDRLDRALEAVENLRELLLGTFDIHMGRAAQEANDTMRVLTLLSAVLLPAVVLAGIMGMNFQMPFFDETANFWVVIAAMALFALTLVAVARRRRWL